MSITNLFARMLAGRPGGRRHQLFAVEKSLKNHLNAAAGNMPQSSMWRIAAALFSFVVKAVP